MSFITTKFHAILLSSFSGVALSNCFSSIFHFCQISKFKKSVIQRKKNGIKISCGYAHIHIMSFITTKFQRSCTNKKNGSIFHLGQISKFKKYVTSRKKWNHNFLWICASTHYVLHNYKVSRNSVERFQRSYASKKNRTDGLTD